MTEDVVIECSWSGKTGRDPEATIVKKATDFTTDSGDLRVLDHLPKNPALRRKRGRAELRSPFNAS
jgi:hypothetical protein